MNFLPGWHPAFIASSRLTSITQVLSATSTAATINFPAGIQAGDLIVMFDAAFGTVFSGTAPTSVTPTGFTVARENTGGGAGSPFRVGRFIISYKLATGSETGALTGMDGDEDFKAMYVFRGNAPATAITLGGAGGNISDGNPTAVTIGANAGTPPLVVIGGYASSGAIDPRTFSTTKDGEINPSTRCYLAYKIYNTGPASTDVDMDDEGATNGVLGCYLAMAN